MSAHTSPTTRRAYRRRLLTSAGVVLLVTWLSACSIGPIGLPGTTPDTTLTIATVFPTTGADAALGQSMQRAVDLAVQQNAALAKGYRLATLHFDEASSTGDQAAATVAANHSVMGIVGPFSSQTAVGMLPTIEQDGLVTISPSAMLPGLTLADQAAAEGLTFTQLHPAGKPVAFFRLPATDTAAGKVAANLAVAPANAHGLAARSAFVVDDGTADGKALAAAFGQDLKAQHGSVAGQQSLVSGAPDSTQAAVSAIVEANPDFVFYAGAAAPGAQLRSTLSLSGAPQLTILTAGSIAADPMWSASVGVAAAAAYTTAILPAQALSTLPAAQSFITAYQVAFSGQTPRAQSALAYDAAMDEIAVLRALVTVHKPVTRAAVLAAVTAAHYVGVTGTLAFDANGDSATPAGFSLYTCDTSGAWHYQAALSG